MSDRIASVCLEQKAGFATVSLWGAKNFACGSTGEQDEPKSKLNEQQRLVVGRFMQMAEYELFSVALIWVRTIITGVRAEQGSVL